MIQYVWRRCDFMNAYAFEEFLKLFFDEVTIEEIQKDQPKYLTLIQAYSDISNVQLSISKNLEVPKLQELEYQEDSGMDARQNLNIVNIPVYIIRNNSRNPIVETRLNNQRTFSKLTPHYLQHMKSTGGEVIFEDMSRIQANKIISRLKSQ